MMSAFPSLTSTVGATASVLLSLLEIEPPWQISDENETCVHVLCRVQTSVSLSQSSVCSGNENCLFAHRMGIMYRVCLLGYFFLCSVSSVPDADLSSS